MLIFTLFGGFPVYLFLVDISNRSPTHTDFLR